MVGEVPLGPNAEAVGGAQLLLGERAQTAPSQQPPNGLDQRTLGEPLQPGVLGNEPPLHALDCLASQPARSRARC
eukprot:4619317-Lingulodinium_polyedra.AAC.1